MILEADTAISAPMMVMVDVRGMAQASNRIMLVEHGGVGGGVGWGGGNMYLSVLRNFTHEDRVLEASCCPS